MNNGMNPYGGMCRLLIMIFCPSWKNNSQYSVEFLKTKSKNSQGGIFMKTFKRVFPFIKVDKLCLISE